MCNGTSMLSGIGPEHDDDTVDMPGDAQWGVPPVGLAKRSNQGESCARSRRPAWPWVSPLSACPMRLLAFRKSLQCNNPNLGEPELNMYCIVTLKHVNESTAQVSQ